jgi:hypothetical protein
MLELAKNGYTKEEVIRQLHLINSTREIKFRYDLLNKHEVKIGELSTLPGGHITMNSLAEIKRVGEFKFKESEIKDVDWLNDRVQPFFMLKMPKGDFIEWPLGIFLMSSPTEEEKGNRIYRNVECYDEALILKEDAFDSRYLIRAGTNYIDAITAILNQAEIWKINIPYINAKIGIDKEWEIGINRLEAVNELLTELNYTSIWVDAYGYFTAQPYVLPNNREAEYNYKTDRESIIIPGAIRENDFFSMPNKWVAYVSSPEKPPLISIFINDNAASPTSTVNRGRVITKLIKRDDILDKITLDEFVKRIAYDDLNVFEEFNFKTALMPHHTYLDCLYVEHSDFEGVAMKYIETSWEMELKAGGQMMHNVRRVIHI